jgi:hypothetical protein
VTIVDGSFIASTATQSICATNVAIEGLRLVARLADAKFDEFRISNTNLSAAWIATEYNNQNSPGTFFTVSTQQPQGGGGSEGSWYNGAWNYRKPITIASGQVVGSLTNFPVLVSDQSDSNLAASALSTGYDILFTAADGVTIEGGRMVTKSTGHHVSCVAALLALSPSGRLHVPVDNSWFADRQGVISVNPTQMITMEGWLDFREITEHSPSLNCGR